MAQKLSSRIPYSAGQAAFKFHWCYQTTGLWKNTMESDLTSAPQTAQLAKESLSDKIHEDVLANKPGDAVQA
jgi:hypothetical protein